MDYVMQEIVVPVLHGGRWEEAEEARLLCIARGETEPYQVEAEGQYEAFEEKYSFRKISREPRVFLNVLELGQMQLILRITTPSRRQRLIQDRVLRRYFTTAAPPSEAGQVGA